MPPERQEGFIKEKEKKRYIMKRLFRYGAMLAVLLMAGCVAGEKTEKNPVEIGFRPVIGHDVRASEESIPFPESWTFNVWATRTSDGGTAIHDETITHATDGWLANEIWPESSLVFAAYYPSTLQPEYTPGHGFVLRDFNASTGDADILVAKETEASPEAEGLVPLHFEHILSRVDFRVRHSLAANIEVVAKKVEIKGFDLTGDYNVGGDHKWAIDNTGGSILVYDAGEAEGLKVTDTAQYIGGEYFTIPQHCKGEIVVTFLVRIDNGGWVEDTVSTGPLDSDWQPGTQYTYTVNLTDTRLTYTTGISSWTSKEH